MYLYTRRYGKSEGEKEKGEENTLERSRRTQVSTTSDSELGKLVLDVSRVSLVSVGPRVVSSNSFLSNISLRGNTRNGRARDLVRFEVYPDIQRDTRIAAVVHIRC